MENFNIKSEFVLEKFQFDQKFIKLHFDFVKESSCVYDVKLFANVARLLILLLISNIVH